MEIIKFKKNNMSYRKNSSQGAGYSSTPRKQGAGYTNYATNSSNSTTFQRGGSSTWARVDSNSKTYTTGPRTNATGSKANIQSKSSQIRTWAGTKCSLDEMIRSYEERTGNDSFESIVFEKQQKYFEDIVTYLAKFRRNDVLNWYFNSKIPELIEKLNLIKSQRNQTAFSFESTGSDALTETSSIASAFNSDVYDFENIKNYTFKPNSTSMSYSPINHALWSDKPEVSEEKLFKMKDTVNLLVNYGFDFEVSKIIDNNGVKTIEYENPIKAITNSTNMLPEAVRNELYDFIMYEIDNRKFWMNHCKKILNANGLIVDRCKDLVYMFGIHNTEDIVEDRFKLLIDSRIIPLSRNFIESNPCLKCFEIWTSSTPPVSESIFNRYYQNPRSNVAENPNRVVQIILTNGETYIAQYLSKRDADEDSECRTNTCYKALLLILGIFYSKGFYQSDILEKLKSIMVSKPNIFNDSFVHFLLGGRINLNQMSIELRDIVSTVASSVIGTKYYSMFNFNMMDYIQQYIGKKIYSLPALFSNLVDPRIEYKYTEKMIQDGSIHHSERHWDDEEPRQEIKVQRPIKPIYQKKVATSSNSTPRTVLKAKQVSSNKFKLLDVDDEEEKTNQASQISQVSQASQTNPAEMCTILSVDDINEDSDLVIIMKSVSSGGSIEDITYSLEKKNKQEVNQLMGLAIIATVMERSGTDSIQRIKNFVSYMDSISDVKLSNILKNYSANEHVKNYFVDYFDVPKLTYDLIVSKIC